MTGDQGDGTDNAERPNARRHAAVAETPSWRADNHHGAHEELKFRSNQLTKRTELILACLHYGARSFVYSVSDLTLARPRTMLHLLCALTAGGPCSFVHIPTGGGGLHNSVLSGQYPGYVKHLRYAFLHFADGCRTSSRLKLHSTQVVAPRMPEMFDNVTFS